MTARLGAVAMVLFGCGASTPDPAPGPAPSVLPSAPEEFAGVELIPEQGNLFGLLEQEYSYAAQRGLVAHVQVYADWCAPCRVVREQMHHPSVAPAFQGVWIVRLQADAWRGALQGSGYDEPSDIPRFHEIGPDGRPTGRKVTGAAWGEDLPENIGPALHRYFHP